MSKVLCCFKLLLSGQVTTGKVGAAKVDRRAAARTGTGRQRSLRRASGRPRAISPRRWGAQVPFHSQLPHVPPHTRSRPAGRACSQRPQHGGCTASRSTNGPSRPGPGEGKREPSPNSVFSQCHSPRRLCGSSWVTLRVPWSTPSVPLQLVSPFPASQQFILPTWTPRLPGLSVCPWPAGSRHLRAPRGPGNRPWDCGFRHRGPRVPSDPACHGLTAQSQTQSWTEPRGCREPHAGPEPRSGSGCTVPAEEGLLAGWASPAQLCNREQPEAASLP